MHDNPYRSPTAKQDSRVGDNLRLGFYGGLACGGLNLGLNGCLLLAATVMPLSSEGMSTAFAFINVLGFPLWFAITTNFSLPASLQGMEDMLSAVTLTACSMLMWTLIGAWLMTTSYGASYRTGKGF
jgi:hypothetical protein